MTGPVDWDALVLGPLEQVFAEPATYTPFAPRESAAITVLGVFDDETLDLDPLNAQANSLTTRPVFGVRLAQWSSGGPAVNDRLVRVGTGVAYIVREVRPDSHGWAKLCLNEARVP